VHDHLGKRIHDLDRLMKKFQQLGIVNLSSTSRLQLDRSFYHMGVTPA
jgi:hypothetical protein